MSKKSAVPTDFSAFAAPIAQTFSNESSLENLIINSFANSKKENVTLLNEIRTLKSENATLLNEIRTLKSENAGIKSDISSLTNIILRMEAKLSESRSAEIQIPTTPRAAPSPRRTSSSYDDILEIFRNVEGMNVSSTNALSDCMTQISTLLKDKNAKNTTMRKILDSILRFSQDNNTGISFVNIKELMLNSKSAEVPRIILETFKDRKNPEEFVHIERVPNGYLKRAELKVYCYF